ncbi:MAG: HTH-type transcriptional regulator CysL [Syntrophorhabdus sp. PtaU1.Bin153]|nr:MAG: HTH-type transcriptional regulator CysL [Syntrophorhabdus sp. PtaU1.Bin153]
MFLYSTKSMIVFYVAVHSRSFTKAAENLFMTQPGVSIHIGQLESQLGVKLLNRKGGEFKLTKEGKALFKCAEKVHKISVEFEKLATDFRKDADIRLTIGATPTYCKWNMPKVILSFTSAYPGSQLKIQAENSDVLGKKLLSMEIDVAVAPHYKPCSQLWSVPFATEELTLLASPEHELASKELVSFQDIKNYPLALREDGSATRKIVVGYFRSIGMTPQVAVEVNNTDFIREWVFQNKGVSIVSRTAAIQDQRLKAIPINEKLYLEVHVLCLKARRYEIPINRFIRHLVN